MTVQVNSKCRTARIAACNPSRLSAVAKILQSSIPCMYIYIVIFLCLQ